MSTHSPGNTVAKRFILGVTTLLTGLSAGFFATYEYSVTRALIEVNDPVYVSTFQAINATVRSLEFGIIFFGSLVALVIALVVSKSNRTTLSLLGLALVAYIAMLAITFAIHIPLNDALALVDASTSDIATAARAKFETRWNEMHLIRTVSVVIAFACTVAALTVPFSVNKKDIHRSLEDR